MKDNKIDALRKRVAARREAVSWKLKANTERQDTIGGQEARPTPSASFDQLSLQAHSAAFDQHTETTPIGAPLEADVGTQANRPTAPTGRWRCIVNSRYVSIDLIASIASNGSLSGQGTLIYVATNKVYNVSGQGDWTALPPDPASQNWLFKFRLQPSNHAIFSWFAAPTSSPNHLSNRFVVPNNGGVVETNCERIG